MEFGVAEARRRFREILDRVESGETVEIARRGQVVAVVAPPVPEQRRRESLAETLHKWRERWAVDAWPDDDPFGEVRDRSPGRPAPW